MCSLLYVNYITINLLKIKYFDIAAEERVCLNRCVGAVEVSPWRVPSSVEVFLRWLQFPQ